MHSWTRWRRASEIFENEEIWNAVNEREKRDIYDDVIFYLAKKEKEDDKQLRARNREYMLEIFSNISTITYRTLWVEVGSFSLLFILAQVHLSALGQEDCLVIL